MAAAKALHKPMDSDGQEEPIFVIGMPRSGSTVLFEALARHPALGWPSNYSEKFPRWPAVNLIRRLLDNRWIQIHGRKRQYGSVQRFNRLLPQPDEAYRFWNEFSGVSFGSSALPGGDVDAKSCKNLHDATAALLRWQGGRRLAAKLTGPARIAFLNAVFPNAFFVHIIRDGRAVVHSLLRVNFWRDKGGLKKPFWDDLLLPEDIAQWQESGNDAGILAALQWKRMIVSARAESDSLATGRYSECHYEDLVRNPHAVIGDVLKRVGLEDNDAVSDFIDEGTQLQNMNHKYLQDLEPEYIARLSAVMEPVLGSLGYS